MAREIRVGGLRVDIGVGFEEVRKGLDFVEKQFADLSKKLSSLGGPKLTLGLKASVLGIGAATIKAGKDFDEAQAQIIRATGETGIQLDKLKVSLVKTFAGNDDSIGEVAQALSKVYQRTGEAGEGLEKLTGKFLDLNDITGQDTNSLVEGSTKLFESWGVAVEEQTEKLDLLLATSQKFGINFSELEGSLVSAGPVLRQLGLSLQDSALLLANMSKEGVNAEGVLAGLKKGIATFVEKGKSPQEALKATLDLLKEMGNQKGLKGAKDIFGKNFLDVFDAVKKGVFELDTAKQKLGDFTNQISKTAEESQTLGQKLSVFWNSVTTALAPVGTGLVDAFKAFFDLINPWVAEFATGFNLNLKILGVSIDGFTDNAIAKFKLAFELIFDYGRYTFERLIDYIRQVGESIAGLIKTLASVAATAMNPASLISGKGIELVTQNFNGLKESLTKVGEVGENAAKTLAKIEELKQSAAKFGFTKEQTEKLAVLHGELEAIAKSAPKAKKGTDDADAAFGKLTGTADKAAEAVKKINDQLTSFRDQQLVKGINDSINKAFETNNLSGLEDYKQKLYDYTYQSTLDGLKDSIKAGGPEALAQAQVLAAEKASAEVDQINERQADHYGDALKKQLDSAADFFSDALYNVFTGQSFNLEDIGKRFAAGFAGGLLGGLFPEAGGFGDLQGIGKTIGQELISGFTGFLNKDGKGILSDVLGGSFSGIFSNITGARPDGVQGPLMESGQFATPSASILGIAATAAATAAFVYDTNSSNLKEGNSTKTGATAAIDSIFPGIGSALSKIGIFGGSKDPQTVARDEAISKLTDAIEKFGKVDFFDSQGKLQTVNKLSIGDNLEFDSPGWMTGLQDQFGANTVNAFSGIGEALRITLGITEDIGGQIGAILLDNVGGSIDGLKQIIQATGLTYETFIESMITEGKKGEDSWLSIVSQINAGTEAFQKGLSGTGQYIKALQNFLQTSGKGGQALTQLQGIAVEAGEVSIQALSQLQDELLKSGQFTTIQIDALFNALAQGNIKTVEELANATDLQLANATAAIDAYFQDNGNGWSDIREQIAQTSQDIAKINGQDIQLTFDVSSSIDDNTRALMENGLLKNNEFDISLPTPEVEEFATGGILSGPTMIRPGALAGEAGPEAILPLKNVNGKLGVSAFTDMKGRGYGSVTINVDARNAERGVEADIINALDSLEERITDKIYNIMSDGG